MNQPLIVEGRRTGRRGRLVEGREECQSARASLSGHCQLQPLNAVRRVSLELLDLIARHHHMLCDLAAWVGTDRAFRSLEAKIHAPNSQHQDEIIKQSKHVGPAACWCGCEQTSPFWAF